MGRREVLLHPAKAALAAAICLCSLAQEGSAGSKPPFNLNGIAFTPKVGSLLGYSTNPDEVPDGESSAFVRYDAGLEAAMKAGASRLKMEVNGTLVKYEDLDKDLRWLYEAKASGETKITKSDILEYDLRHRRDNLDDRYDELSHRARAFWTHTADEMEVKLGAVFRNKDFLEPASHNEFDYLSPGAELTLRAFPNGQVSPFAVLRAARLDYLNQVESIIDRDAMNYSVTAGVQWQPVKTFELSFGGRYNLRDVEDKDFDLIDNVFADLQLRWSPSDRFDIKAAVWRELAEPYKSNGVAADQITSELQLAFEPAERIRLEGKGSIQWEHEIGSNVDSMDYEVSATGYYEVNSSLRAYLRGRQLWENDRNTARNENERSTTTEFIAGIETTF